MKIAFFHELGLGGARRAVGELGKQLKSRHSVDLFYVDASDRETGQPFHKRYFYEFKQAVWFGGNWKVKLYKDTIELLRLSFLHRKIAKDIDQRKYDAVFVHPSQFTQAPFLLRFLKTPSFYYCQEPLRIVYDSSLAVAHQMPFAKKIYEQCNRFIRKHIDRQNLTNAKVILVNSSFSKNWIEKAYGAKAHLCYLGVDTGLFKPMAAAKAYDILFLGEKVAIEGYDLLGKILQLFAKKPTVKIISRGKDGTGISDKELVSAYNKAKIVVCLSRNEPFGLTVLEAMACETPVVATAEGGFVESVVDGETGFLVQANAQDVKRVIARLLRDGRVRKRIGRKAREHVVSNWSWEKSAKRVEEILEVCLKEE